MVESSPAEELLDESTVFEGESHAGPCSGHASKFPAAAFGLRAPTRSGPPAGADGVSKDEELFAEGDEADCFYQVVSGAVRSYRAPERRRRQIDAFTSRANLRPGTGAEHRFSAEALGNASVIAYRRSRLAALTQDEPAFRDRIMSSTLRSLERAQDQAAARTQDRPGKAGDVPPRPGAAPSAATTSSWSCRCSGRTLPTISASP